MWTYRESNPDLFHAMEPFYRYTIGPSEDSKWMLAYTLSERRVYIDPLDIGPYVPDSNKLYLITLAILSAEDSGDTASVLKFASNRICHSFAVRMRPRDSRRIQREIRMCLLPHHSSLLLPKCTTVPNSPRQHSRLLEACPEEVCAKFDFRTCDHRASCTAPDTTPLSDIRRARIPQKSLQIVPCSVWRCWRARAKVRQR